MLSLANIYMKIIYIYIYIYIYVHTYRIQNIVINIITSIIFEYTNIHFNTK